MISTMHHIRKIVIGAAVALSACLPASAAVDINGYKFEDTAKVAGKDLKLNGAGVRIKVVVKLYAAGLYVPEKKSTAAEILKQQGPRRVTIQMMRDINTDEFGKAFIDGLNENIDKNERQQIIPQIGQMGALFTSVETLKAGDVLHMDWVPGVGTQADLNGKKLGAAIPDITFYNAMLRIWIGDHAVDKFLKQAMLGETN